jgi:stearoyl-CoA desaturase (delta-9 desaturase)
MLIKFVLFFVVYLFLTNLSINIGYHRYLAHKSFEMTPWFRYLAVFIGIPAGTPIQWAGNHRQHHKFTDTEKDPHSPYYGGLWHAHCGWYIYTKKALPCFLYAIAGPLRTIFDSYHRPRTNQEYVHLATDIREDKVFELMSRPSIYMLLCLLHVSALFLITFYIFGGWGPLVAWFCSAYVYNLGDSIDSLGHWFGKQPYVHPHRATDNYFLAMITFGDGWHASHHSFPSSAKHGLLPGQFDFSYIMLRIYEKLGLVSNLKCVNQKTVQGALK